MSPKDFVSFLNGAIELGELRNLNAKNFKLVNDKLDGIKLDTSQEGAFCNWLKGFLDAVEDNSLVERKFNKITVKLFDLNLEKPTQAKPNGLPKSSGDNLVRC